MTRADDALKLLTVPTFLETDQGGIKEAAPIILLFIQLLKKQVIDFQEREFYQRQEKMALSVKAYIHPDTNQQEIRRFAIDEGVSASYAYLAQKIEQVFPVVRGKIFKLFWKGKAYLVYFDFKFARWKNVTNTGSNADKHFFALICNLQRRSIAWKIVFPFPNRCR